MIGKIYKGIGGFYYVNTEKDGVFECKARGRFRKEHIIPMIGDEVELEGKNGKGSIISIHERRTKMIRPAVANIDMIVVVAAAASPEPNTNLIDKMLVNAEINGIDAIVCINKTDLADGTELVRLYENAGYKAVSVSAEVNNGLDRLTELIRGKTAAFAGVSGVGKSSILTHLVGNKLETGAVSEKISRGRHTTRHVELFPMKDGGYVLDTPGFSSIEAEDITAENLENCFPEFRIEIGKCRFRGCAHINEPECAVKDAVNEGKIAKSRYETYTELYEIMKGKKQWK